MKLLVCMQRNTVVEKGILWRIFCIIFQNYGDQIFFFFFFYALKFRALRCFGQNLTFVLNFIKKEKEKCVYFCNF